MDPTARAIADGAVLLLDVKGLSENTDNAFRWRLIEVARELGADPDHMSAVMSVESAATFSPSVRNPNGGATGLIQFMPATAKRLGTTTAELAAMTATEQLEYVLAYYRPFTGKLDSPEDVYMATFMPIFVGRSPDNVVGRQDDPTPIPGAGSLTYGAVYAANKGFDVNHDGVITNGEVGSLARGRLEAARNRPPIEVWPESSSGAGGLPFLGPVIALAGAYLLWRGLS